MFVQKKWLLISFAFSFFTAFSREVNLTSKEQVALSAAAGLVEGVVGVPCTNLGNFMMRDRQGLGAALKFFAQHKSKLMVGFGANSASMLPACAAQKAIKELCSKQLDVTQESPFLQRVLVAVAAGVGATAVVNPTDRVIFLQGGSGRNAWSVAKEIVEREGLRGGVHGGMATAVRDAVFVAAWFAFGPAVKKEYVNRFSNLTDKNLIIDVGASMASALTVGAPASLGTQWAHEIRARQFNQTDKNGTSFVQTALDMYRVGGVREFYQAPVPRLVRVVLALGVLSKFEELAPCYYTKLKN